MWLSVHEPAGRFRVVVMKLELELHHLVLCQVFTAYGVHHPGIAEVQVLCDGVEALGDLFPAGRAPESQAHQVGHVVIIHLLNLKVVVSA